MKVYPLGICPVLSWRLQSDSRAKKFPSCCLYYLCFTETLLYFEIKLGCLKLFDDVIFSLMGLNNSCFFLLLSPFFVSNHLSVVALSSLKPLSNKLTESFRLPDEDLFWWFPTDHCSVGPYVQAHQCCNGDAEVSLVKSKTYLLLFFSIFCIVKWLEEPVLSGTLRAFPGRLLRASDCLSSCSPQHGSQSPRALLSWFTGTLC